MKPMAGNNLLLYYLDDILILQTMAKTTMLWIVPSADSPHKHIFHILKQAAMDMIAEVFNCAATPILEVSQNQSHQTVCSTS